MHKEGLFACFPRATRARYQTLIRLFSSLDSAWQANAKELSATQWDTALIAAFIRWREQLNETEIEKQLAQEQIQVISIHQPEYPKEFLVLNDAPFCLFIRGGLSHLPRLAVVGPRKPSAYAKHITQQFVKELVTNHQLSIVSGLAFGVDSIAHQTAITHGGHTIAVVPGGVNNHGIAPQKHLPLAENILSHQGALISEKPINAPITPYAFPERNRIIAALSQATLVIEAAQTSGALITASYALEQGKDVLAIPQNITSETSIGVNRLISQGAQVIQQVDDIVSLLGLRTKKEQQTPPKRMPSDPFHAKLFSYLDPEIPMHIDDMLRAFPEKKSIIASSLTLLELQQFITQIGGMHYIQKR